MAQLVSGRGWKKPQILLGAQVGPAPRCGAGDGVPVGCQPCPAAVGKGLLFALGRDPAGGGLLLLSAGSLSFPSYTKAKPQWRG